MSSNRLFKLIGYKAIYLTFCKRFNKNPIPLNIPIFGKIKTYHEIINIHDMILFNISYNEELKKLETKLPAKM